MKLTVFPGFSLNGEVSADIPGDKSISHRAALFAALAVGKSRIDNFQVSGVTRPMLLALSSLGVDWQLDSHTLTVSGKGLTGLKSPDSPIDCGNSATTLRLLTGAIAAAGISAVLDGSAGLRRRPMERIVEPLRQMGVILDPSLQGTAPLILHARSTDSTLVSLHYTLPVASAQVKSCLLLAGLAAKGTSTLSEPGPSRDHTERMLSSMGVQINAYPEEAQFVVKMTPPDPLRLTPLNLSIPGDPSAAAFLIVAALICPGSALSIKGICLNSTRTGLLDALISMGARITIHNQHLAAGEPVGDLAVEYGKLHGTVIDGPLVVRMIDEFPALSIAAACAQGTTEVRGAAELRLKESDRISTLAGELRKLGVAIEEHPDGFTLQGGCLKGGEVQAHGDHRLAMSLAVAGFAADAPISVQGAECINESFPGFTDTLQKLGAKQRIEESD